MDAKLNICIVLVFLFVGVRISHAQIANQHAYHYAIESLDSGEVIRRGANREAGIPLGELILPSNRDYRIWLYERGSGLMSFHEFRTPEAGQGFELPALPLRLPEQPDADGDGLSGEAELVFGTNPNVADSDGDGISDGAEVEQGTDPLDDFIVETGIFLTRDTDGVAVDVATFNNLAVIADSGRGISVFNIFNTMEATIIAQVDTPGNARAVAYPGGTRIAVADGAEGMAIVDISDPPRARIREYVFADMIGGGSVVSVAATGDLAFVGTSRGALATIDMRDGVVIDTVELDGGQIDDVVLYGEALYTLQANQLRVFEIGGDIPLAGASISTSGQRPGGPGRWRLFLGGGIAYATHRNGYNTIDVRDPETPVMIAESNLAQSGWKQIVVSGSGKGLAATGTVFNSGPAESNVRVHLTADPTVTDQFELEIATPGSANAVSIYNGLGYVADATAGLQVLNFLSPDVNGVAPEGNLRVLVEGPEVVEGQMVRVRAVVTDDVQVRNVEFFANGVRVATDGSFPFEVGYRVPESAVGSVEFTAIVRDTANNRARLGPDVFNVISDDEAPTVALNSTFDDIFIEGDWIVIDLEMSDNVGIRGGEVVVYVDGERVVGIRQSQTRWLIQAPPAGLRSLRVEVSDAAGNVTVVGPVEFKVGRERLSREISLFNYGSDLRRPESLSREISLFNYGSDLSRPESLSREISLFNYGSDLSRPESLSREISLFNYGGDLDRSEAVSREISVENTNE